jgi:hypothetical protein
MGCPCVANTKGAGRRARTCGALHNDNIGFEGGKCQLLIWIKAIRRTYVYGNPLLQSSIFA